MLEQNKTAVVLGASGGIGEAICHSLASSGWSLYLHYNDRRDAAERLQHSLQQAYPMHSFQLVQADLRVVTSGETLARKLRSVRAIVVASGHSSMQLLSDTSAEEMESLWRVHVQSPALLIQQLAPTLRQFATSYVIFISSIWGTTGAAGEVMYSAVKGAQQAFVKAYAKEAAYSGTRVNAIAPGWIETSMNDCLTVEEKQMVVDQIPLRRTGEPQEVAALVSFLLSGQADYMTGEVIQLNGGWHI